MKNFKLWFGRGGQRYVLQDIKFWLIKTKMKLAMKWAAELGFSVVKLRVVAGTTYIVDNNGAQRKIGRRA